MVRSLRSWLFITYVALVAVALLAVAVGVLAYLWRNPALERQAALRLDAALQIATRRLNPHAPSNNPRLSAALQRIGETLEVRFLILDAQGNALLDTQPNAPHITAVPHTLRGLARDAEGKTWLYAARPWGNGGRLVALTPRPNRVRALLAVFRDDLLPPLLRAGLLALALALLLAYALSRWVARPLDKMAEAARALAAGEHRPIPVEGPAEVQALAQTFNEMSRQVQASQQSQRDFVANVSHELKTPLTSIQGFAQAILDGTANDPESLRQAAQIIHDEAARMHRLVLDLLELARLDAGTADLRREPVDLAALARNVAQRMAPQAQEAQVTLTVAGADSLIVYGDGDRLAQVLLNLVDNALKHTPAGGQVTVSVHAQGGWAEVRVQDTGEGIPPEVLPRIVERFYQLDQARQGGAGLGLSIAYEIVRAHGGTLTAQSEPGKGSVFVVKLPRAAADGLTLK